MSSSTINALNMVTTITNGVLTAGSYVEINNGNSVSTITFQVFGTFSLTLGVLSTVDGVNFEVLPVNSITRAGTGALGAPTVAGIYTVTVPAGQSYVYCSAYTSGSAIVTVLTGPATNSTPGDSGSGTDVTPIPTQGTPSATNPTFASGSSVTLLAANANRKYLNIQNNTTFNILVSWTNATLTGAAPSASNPGMIIYGNGGGYEWPLNYVPTGAITGYQASGSSTNLVSVTEGS